MIPGWFSGFEFCPFYLAFKYEMSSNFFFHFRVPARRVLARRNAHFAIKLAQSTEIPMNRALNEATFINVANVLLPDSHPKSFSSMCRIILWRNTSVLYVRKDFLKGEFWTTISIWSMEKEKDRDFTATTKIAILMPNIHRL